MTRWKALINCVLYPSLWCLGARYTNALRRLKSLGEVDNIPVGWSFCDTAGVKSGCKGSKTAAMVSPRGCGPMRGDISAGQSDVGTQDLHAPSCRGLSAREHVKSSTLTHTRWFGSKDILQHATAHASAEFQPMRIKYSLIYVSGRKRC